MGELEGAALKSTRFTPSKPRAREPLPRLSNEMAKDKWQRSPQSRSSSYSPNCLNRSRDYNYSFSPSPSRSPSPDNHTEVERLLDDYIPESKLEEFLEINPRFSKFSADYQVQLIKEFLNSQSKKPKSRPLKQNESPSESFWPVFKVLCMIFSILGGMLIFVPSAGNTANVGEYREKATINEISRSVEENLRELKKEFRNQEAKIWEEIYSGIVEVISRPKKPSIFVLFADTNNPMSCLASKIGDLSSKALGIDKTLILNPAQLDEDTGEVIESLRKKITQQKSVIVWDLLSINTAALKAFHNLCDSENPLVKGAIYIITVKVEGYHSSIRPIEFIENKLRSNLSGRLDEDSIMPLITRITDGAIISVKPESNLPCIYKNTIFQ